MQNVFEVADKVVVLRLGETVLEGRKKDLTPEDVVSCITGSRTTIGGMA
jgi:D-xylose transport system ATP-binding protein